MIKIQLLFQKDIETPDIIDILKEALIKSDVQIAPSDFSSDCAKATQESCRISSGFCAFLAENMQVSCASKPML